MVLKSCCCCSLQTGCITISIIGLMCNIVYGIILAVQLSRIRYYHEYTGAAVFSVFAAVFETVISFVLAGFNMALFRGAYLQRRSLVIAWLWCSIITACTRDIYQIIQGFIFGTLYGNPVVVLIYSILVIAAIATFVYSVWVVYSFSQELKIQQEEQQMNEFQSSLPTC